MCRSFVVSFWGTRRRPLSSIDESSVVRNAQESVKRGVFSCHALLRALGTPVRSPQFGVRFCSQRHCPRHSATRFCCIGRDDVQRMLQPKPPRDRVPVGRGMGQGGFSHCAGVCTTKSVVKGGVPPYHRGSPPQRWWVSGRQEAVPLQRG